MKRALRLMCGLWLVYVSLTGCVTVPPLQTPSQRPEVTIPGVTKKEVIDVLVSEMVASGAQVRQTNDYTAVFSKRDTSLGGALVYGSKYDSFPETRLTFNFVDTSGGIRVFCNAAMITNPGSAFERVNDVTGGKTAHEMQGMLERLKATLQR